MFKIDARAAPALLIHGTADPLAPPDQSTRACAAIANVGGSCELILLPGEGHSFSADPGNRALVATRIKHFIISFHAR